MCGPEKTICGRICHDSFWSTTPDVENQSHTSRSDTRGIAHPTTQPFLPGFMTWAHTPDNSSSPRYMLHSGQSSHSSSWRMPTGTNLPCISSHSTLPHFPHFQRPCASSPSTRSLTVSQPLPGFSLYLWTSLMNVLIFKWVTFNM